MRNKAVIWGTNGQNEKVLMALELKEAENKVFIYVIPEPKASDELISKLNETWRENKGEVEFPEGHTVVTRELTVSENILPDDLKADRPDQVTRAQTEWQFIVLSSKLHKVYQQELEGLKEKVGALSEYDNAIWQNLKAFWDKVQEQSRERNLFRSHADELRDTVNQLFDDMKGIRKKADAEFSEVSGKILAEINEKMAEIEAKIEKGSNKMHIIFDELKQLQSKYRTAKLTNEHRGKAFDRIDAGFKAAKEKRFGADANEGSLVDRHNHRLKGLLEAMNRMKDSARRDEQELEFQRKKVQSTEGQLEAQIRQAKIKMVEERLNSKLERIADMEKTKADVERQIASVQDREEKRKRMDNAKSQAKSEIAAITNKGEGGSRQASGAKAAAGDDSLHMPATQSVMDALTNVLGETFEDVVDTVKAVASVVADKAEEALEKAGVVAEEVVEIVTKERPDAEAPKAEAPAETEAPVAEPAAEAPVAEAPAEPAADADAADSAKDDEEKPA
jgi:DNA repair exonuclease SbcCD ATPase subunit